jgi:hypothetical protein
MFTNKQNPIGKHTVDPKNDKEDYGVEKSSQKEQTGNTNELKQMENNPQNDAPAGTENLEQNIDDPTARYEDLDVSNTSPRQ